MRTRQRSQRKIALFAGAGASKAFEFPLTGEIFPEIRRGIKKRNLFGRGEKAQRLHLELEKFLDGIYPGLRVTPDNDLPLITDVLSLVDHSLVSANAIGLSVQRRDLQRLRRLLERAIYKALDWDTDYDARPKLLHMFVDSLRQLRENGVHVGFISTNYDPVVEVYLFKRIKNADIVKTFDFGCEWRDDGSGKVYNRPLNPTMSIFKLHGSLNMLRCPHCDHMYINLDGDVSYLDYDGAGNARPDGWNQCHCEYAPLEACMIAPSSVRDVRESNLLEIWRHSLEFLRRANDWIIMGYSFPPEDIGIRSMFCRAYQGRAKKPRVTIVQQGCDPKTMARYKIMFPDCRYECGGMEQFIKAFANDSSCIHSLPRIDRITPSARFTL
jgi:hypothetical protein